MLSRRLTGAYFFLAICSFGAFAKIDCMSEVLHSPTKTYTLLETLGEGVFGKVYFAKDSSGNMFAIKRYKDIGDSRGFYSDPKREYEIGRKLNHPNIIKSYEYFSETKKNKVVHYLVLQYVNGKQLYKYSKGCMKVKESLAAYDRLLSALTHALNNERVYLDLHFGNLMLSQNHQIMIIDLASFFTFDEIHEYFHTKVIKKGPNIDDTRVTHQDCFDLNITHQDDLEINQMGKVCEKECGVGDDRESDTGDELITLKKLKLQQFFSSQPELYQKMLRVYQESEESSVQVKGKHRDYLILSYMTYYLERVTEACVHVVMKSNFDRSTRVNFRTRIKRISWNYEEDVDEGIDHPVIQYLQQLRQLTQTL